MKILNWEIEEAIENKIINRILKGQYDLAVNNIPRILDLSLIHI